MSGEPTEIVDGATGNHKTHPTHLKRLPRDQPRQIWVVCHQLALRNLTETQFGVAVLILAIATLIFGFLLMWIVSWLTATPVRVVRAALRRVEQGDLRGDLVVFDGTELGELQSGFNSMVDGLRERERVRDLFGRHVGREVAAAAERERPKLGGEERHVAVVFVDMVGSTQLVTSRPAADVVRLLNRFFAVIVDEVDRHRQRRESRRAGTLVFR
jgi:adenylate cyclase